MADFFIHLHNEKINFFLKRNHGFSNHKVVICP
jgi:hypothetical protein